MPRLILVIVFLPQFKKIKDLVLSDKFWNDLDLAVRLLLPAYKALRYSDGMAGSSLAVLYNKLLDLDEIYGEKIDECPEPLRVQVIEPPIHCQCHCSFKRGFRVPIIDLSSSQVHTLFQNRWLAFHAPIHTACWLMSRAYCRRTIDKDSKAGKQVMKDLMTVICEFCKVPGCPTKVSDLLAEYNVWKNALAHGDVSL